MNEHEEALHNLRQFVELFGEGYPQDVEDFKLNECVKSFGELVEKAKPKKPIFPGENYFFLWKCPSCNQDFISDSANNYCSNCGQALDWSEDE